MDKYLDFLNSFGRMNCPQEHYIAWKIFILKTNEYSIDKMCSAFKHSYTKWGERLDELLKELLKDYKEEYVDKNWAIVVRAYELGKGKV